MALPLKQDFGTQLALVATPQKPNTNLVYVGVCRAAIMNGKDATPIVAVLSSLQQVPVKSWANTFKLYAQENWTPLVTAFPKMFGHTQHKWAETFEFYTRKELADLLITAPSTNDRATASYAMRAIDIAGTQGRKFDAQDHAETALTYDPYYEAPPALAAVYGNEPAL